MNRFALAVSTFFGCGFFPFAPGTAGSLAGLAVAVFLHYLGFGRPALALLILATLVPAVWSATAAERILGREDPGQVVIDEVLGQWVTLLGAPLWNWKSFLASFILFRLFDIWKPRPVRDAEALPGGFGIIADDLMAGVYGALILYIGAQFRLI